MPAQAEEIEAAEREGIVVRTGLAPLEVVSRDGSRGRAPLCRDARRPAAGGDGAWEPIPGHRDARSPPPRSSWRSARSPIRRSCPKGAGIEVSGWAGIVADPGRWPPAGPASSPAATSSPARRPSSTPSRPVAGPRPRSTSTWPASPTARRVILDTVRYATRAREPSSPSTSRRGRGAHAATARWSSPGRSRRRRSASTRRPREPRPSRCFRCDAVYSGPVVRGPRPAAGPDVPTAGRRTHPPDPRHRQEARDDTRPGIRLLRRRRGLHRGDDRGGARRALAARAGAPPRPAATWSGRPASSPFASAPTCGGSSTSALRDLILVQVFLGSFIFFYPDVVAGQDLPITGGLAAVCAFAVLLIKLIRHGGRDARPSAGRSSCSGSAPRSTSCRTSSASR